jgi:Sortase domain
VVLGRLDRLGIALGVLFLALNAPGPAEGDRPAAAARAGAPVVAPVRPPLEASEPAAQPVLRPVPQPARRSEPLPVPVQVADPVRVRIPAVGLDAPLGPLEVAPDGSLAAPKRFDAAGWWRAGPEPGEPGPAVVAGHVDSTRGPAAFFALGRVRPGDEVVVERADGSAVAFRVVAVEVRAKTDFPTAAVYGPTPDPQLRLVTCTGRFDRGARHYLDNMVVYAVAVSP